MIPKHFRPVVPELHLVWALRTVRKSSLGRIVEEAVRTSFNLVAAATVALAAHAVPAVAQQNYADQLTPTPDIEKAGPRYVLMVLDQPDRDLTKGRTKVNVLVDTKTGKTWLLEYARKPDSNEVGYVWSEIPFAKAPGE
jgi:hypothetical protein